MMKLKTHVNLILCIILLFKIFNYSWNRIDKDVTLHYLQAHGYDGDKHFVTTDDGYILALHRIKNGKEVSSGKNHTKKLKPHSSLTKKPPVLFIHGLLSSSVDSIRFLEKESLPYILFENQYDVWLGDCRGSSGSVNHSYLDPEEDKRQFWNSSFHEIGFYDLPAMIDYILNVTNSKKLFYVGMSQGEAAFLILTSTRTEYNNKIQFASLLAPSSHQKYTNNWHVNILGAIWPWAKVLTDAFGIYEVPGNDLIRNICNFKLFAHPCTWYLIKFMGHRNQYSDEVVSKSNIFDAFPTRASAKQPYHYLQIINTGKFRNFDYGRYGNLQQYGTVEPPMYELNRISVPVAIFWGENDMWTTPRDVEMLANSLPNLFSNYKVPDKSFNHGDFWVGKTAPDVYNEVLNFMEKHRYKNM